MFNTIYAFVLCAIVRSDAANILGVFTLPSYSHQVVFRPLMLELANRGHKVVVITPSPVFTMETSHPNLTVIDVQQVPTKFNHELATAIGQETDSHKQLMFSFEVLSKVFEQQLKLNDVQKLIADKNIKFDLIFLEPWPRSAIGFSYLYKAPVIEFSSLASFYDTYDEVGAVSHRLFYPFITRQRLYNLTLWEKLSELYNQFSLEYSYMQVEKMENEITQRVFGSETPDLKELRKNIEMVFLNIHPLWDFNRPVPPNVVYLGGLPRNPEKELPKDLKAYLDASKNGVIYMSFGSSVQPSMLSEEKINIFMNVLADLPYHILLKWDKEELPRKLNNVRISKWFPQSDVLRHPKIKLFITQGGLQSTDEAVMARVPLIAFPMHGDQYFNAELYEMYGIGIKLNIKTVTEVILKEAVETVIGSNSYRENLVKLRNILADRQNPSLESAVWWTDYVLRHGGAAHLRAATAQMTWAEYYLLDLMLLVLIILLTSVITLAIIIRLILKMLMKGFKVKRS